MSASDKKISEFTALPGGSLSGSVVLPGVADGTTYKVSLTQITTQVSTGLDLGTASTYDIGQGGASVPLLSASNTWGDYQIFDNGIKLRSSSGAGDPEGRVYSNAGGDLLFQANCHITPVTFTFMADGTLDIPAGFTFSGGLSIANGGTAGITAAAARTNLAVLGIANNLSDVASAATARTNLAVGGTGTTNTWSSAQTFSVAPVFTDASGSRTAMGAAASATTMTAAGLVTGGGDLSANRTFTVTAATSATVLTGTSTTTAMTIGDTYTAAAEVTLTSSGASIANDMATYINAIHTLTENTTLANPTNPKVGQSGFIRIVQHASAAKTLSFGGNWKRRGGAATISTTLSATDILVYDVITATYILYDVLVAPS